MGEPMKQQSPSRSTSTAKEADGPPIAAEAEQMVLGSIMKDDQAMPMVMEGITGRDFFYSPRHQVIFDAMLILYKAGEPCDITTVASELKNREGDQLAKAGGRTYLAELCEGVGSTANLMSYVKLVVEAYQLRKVADFAGELQKAALSPGNKPQELIDHSSKYLTDITIDSSGNKIQTLGAFVNDAIVRMEARRSVGLIGVPTGYYDLDEMTGGFQPGDLIVIMARPGVGKTALANCMASYQASLGYPVTFFSAETSGMEFATRSACTIARVNSVLFRTGKAKEADVRALASASEKVSQWPFYIDDTGEIEIHRLCARAARQRSLGRASIVFVDYLQRLTANDTWKETREMFSYMVVKLKSLARSIEAPVVVTCQVSRKVDDRKDHRPMLSDGKETGKIDEEADIILGLYRPEIYATEEEKRQRKFEGIAEAIILKQRNGPLGVVPLYFNKTLALFESASTVPPEATMELPF